MLFIFLRRLQYVPRKSKVMSLMVLALGLILFSINLSPLNSGRVLYFIYPAIMVGLAAWFYVIAKPYPKLLLRRSEDKEYMVAGVTALWGIGYFLLGLIFTYGKNPLATSFIALSLNIWAYIIPIVAIEVARFSVLRVLGRAKLWFSWVVVAVFSVLQISMLSIATQRGAIESVEWLVSAVMPVILYNAVATYLGVFAGLRSALIFHIGIYTILTLLPIVPNLDWYLMGMGSIILSLGIYFTVGSTRQDRRMSFRGQMASADGTLSNIVTGIFILVFVLFMANVFVYQPLAIMSNSMHPVYSRGDMVLVKSVKDDSNIEIGDIIKYQKDTTTITHRVVEIKHSEGGRGRVYTTKGDNNTSADSWEVTSGMISGVVIGHAPLVGYPSILLYESFNPDKPQSGVVDVS